MCCKDCCECPCLNKICAIKSKVISLQNKLKEYEEKYGKSQSEQEDVVSDLDKLIEFFVEQINSTKADKTEIPTKVSQLENDANYVTFKDLQDGQYVTEAQLRLILQNINI